MKRSRWEYKLASPNHLLNGRARWYTYEPDHRRGDYRVVYHWLNGGHHDQQQMWYRMRRRDVALRVCEARQIGLKVERHRV